MKGQVSLGLKWKFQKNRRLLLECTGRTCLQAWWNSLVSSQAVDQRLLRIRNPDRTGSCNQDYYGKENCTQCCQSNFFVYPGITQKNVFRLILTLLGRKIGRTWRQQTRGGRFSWPGVRFQGKTEVKQSFSQSKGGFVTGSVSLLVSQLVCELGRNSSSQCKK